MKRRSFLGTIGGAALAACGAVGLRPKPNKVMQAGAIHTLEGLYKEEVYRFQVSPDFAAQYMGEVLPQGMREVPMVGGAERGTYLRFRGLPIEVCRDLLGYSCLALTSSSGIRGRSYHA